MTYSLSVNSIIDTVQAIAALRVFSAPAESCEALTSMLVPTRRALLVSLTKDAFAETLVAILPYVADSNLDSDDSSELLTFELSALDGLPAGANSIIRHSLEQSIAYRVLTLCLLSLPGDESDMANEISDKATFHLDNAISLIRSARANQPFIRCGS